MIKKLKLLAEKQHVEIGFSGGYASVYGMTNAVTLAAHLSDAVVDSITDCPTHAYFHHYRTVNSYLDRCALEIGQLLEENGYRYVPVAASQTVNRTEKKGLFSHKQGAIRAGLGTIGKSGLFLSYRFGPRVRLVTVLTDLDLTNEGAKSLPESICGNCRECVRRCPALALSGRAFDPRHPEQILIDTQVCSDYMKKQFQLIGRGAVCGVCMRHCPAGMKERSHINGFN